MMNEGTKVHMKLNGCFLPMAPKQIAWMFLVLNISTETRCLLSNHAKRTISIIFSQTIFGHGFCVEAAYVHAIAAYFRGRW
jgi:hypothetical protein